MEEKSPIVDDVAGATEAESRVVDETHPYLEACEGMKNLMSYETLTIDDRVRAKASQTATPNNTPRGEILCLVTKRPNPDHK